MRLTRYTDYAMRVLLYLGRQPDRLCSISEIAQAYAISQNHLMKIVNDLVNAGYLESVRGTLMSTVEFGSRAPPKTSMSAR